MFKDFQVSPVTLDSEHDQVQYQGRLIVYSLSGDGAVYGVPDRTVILAGSSGDLSTTRTDDQGRFSGTAHMNHSSSVYAYSPPDATHIYVKTDPTQIAYKRLATRVTISAPATGVIGEEVELTGRLERQSSTGEWGGLGGEPMHISLEGGAQIPDVTTAADGTFTARITQPGTVSRWRASFYGYGAGTADYQPSSGMTGYIQGRWRPSVKGFDAGPEPVAKDGTVTGTGQVLRQNGSGAQEPAAGVTIVPQFSVDGKEWTKTGDPVTTDANGRFVTRAFAPGDGHWRAVVQFFSYLPVGSAADYVDTKYQTGVSGFTVTPTSVAKGGKVTVSGALKRKTTSWKVFAGRTVRVYFQAAGTTTWTYAGSTTTGRTGHFKRRFTATRTGTWRVKYAGNADHLPVTVPGVLVTVR